MLTRQLSESRDSLHFANHLCEQLEARVEELEKSQHELERVCTCRLDTIQQKNQTIEELQERLASLQEEHEKLAQSYHSLEQAAEEEDNEERSPQTRSRSVSFSKKSCSVRSSLSPEAIELQEQVDALTLKLQNSIYQKKRLEQEMQEVVGENQVMGKSLERAEQEIVDMQVRLKAYEERGEGQNYETVPSSPYRSSSILTSTPTHSLEGRFRYGEQNHSVISLGDNPAHGHNVTLESTIGMSLFNELDSQYSGLKEQYDDLLQNCTCSASIHHHSAKLQPKSEGTNSSPPGEVQAVNTCSPRPFRELFEEVFATLKQTAQAADRLIERRTVQ